MELEFWGVRGTVPVSSADTNKYGGHTPCASVISSKGEIIIIDAGTGIKRLGDRIISEKENEPCSIHFLFTHFHLDHIIGFPFFEDIRLYTQYQYEVVDTYDILDTASEIIKSQEGTSTTSSINLGLRRDSRDHRFDPTKGSDNSISVTYAGRFLGGGNDFTKYEARSAWFLTPFWNLTFSPRGRIGFIEGDPTIPLYERFRLGGIYSLRGFKSYSVGPKAPNGEVIGGDKYLLFNFEMLFPIAKEIKLKGLLFFDAGNVWDVGEPYKLDDLRTSVGFGFRWMSPLGPLRLEWGYNLEPREGEERSSWDFTVGAFF